MVDPVNGQALDPVQHVLDRVEPVRWGILGPGAIARRFAGQLPDSRTGRLTFVGSSDPARAREFAEAQPGDVAAGTHEELLDRDDVDAVYVATVHPTHARLTIAALEAGKHVLCEKPLAPDAGSVMAMLAAAADSGRSLVEAYMYRFHPQTRWVLDAVRDGRIGDVLHVDAEFTFRTGSRSGRLFDPELAGGGILDVGGYPVSYARAIAGAASGVDVVEPTDVSAGGTLGPTGVDEWSLARLTFPGGLTAAVRAGVGVQGRNAVTVYGSRGLIQLDDPWTLGDIPTATLTLAGSDPEVLEFTGRPYALEADGLAASIGPGEAPQLRWQDSLGNAQVLDTWRERIGLRYPFEADDADIKPVSGRRLRVDVPGIPRAPIAGLPKPVSRLVLGCDNQPNLSYASAVFDDFFSRGGNTFDTAFHYGGGKQERLLGRWIANRGLRDEVVVITKGAHTPNCNPEALTEQLLQSFERQQTDHADIYLMHRDNPEVPVGEFVDVLNSHVAAGRITIFGGSNWTPARVDEANAYAAAHQLQGFSVLSNHFGLARAYDVPWAGCEHVTDPESRRWLTERQLPLLPWSSQARGFFTGRARPDDRSDPELVRCYYSDDNFERLRRAEKLAAEFGVPATAVALAYVLHQPFPTFPLFGPRTIAEARSSMTALSVELTPDQLAWLDLAVDW